MNKIRRKSVSSISLRLLELQEELELLRDEEQECYDNLPESFQYGEKGEQMEEVIDYLEALSSIEDAIENLDEALSSIEDAIENLDEAIEA